MHTPIPRILSLVAAGLLSSVLFGANAPAPFQHERLTKSWESSAPLLGATAALYDAGADAIYVTRAEGTLKDGNAHGAIARVSTKGEVINASWVDGLNEPRGLALGASRLFVADGQEILSVDPQRERVVSRYRNDRAKTLRGIAVLEDGRIYAADSSGGQLFELRSGIMGNFDGLESVNPGATLLGRGNELLVGHRARLFFIDPTSYKTHDAVRRAATMESFVALDDGSYLVCDAKGVIHWVGGANDKPLKLLDPASGTAPAAGLSAAIGWVPKSRLLLVPLPASGKLVAYQLK